MQEWLQKMRLYNVFTAKSVKLFVPETIQNTSPLSNAINVSK